MARGSGKKRPLSSGSQASHYNWTPKKARVQSNQECVETPEKLTMPKCHEQTTSTVTSQVLRRCRTKRKPPEVFHVEPPLKALRISHLQPPPPQEADPFREILRYMSPRQKKAVMECYEADTFEEAFQRRQLLGLRRELQKTGLEEKEVQHDVVEQAAPNSLPSKAVLLGQTSDLESENCNGMCEEEPGLKPVLAESSKANSSEEKVKLKREVVTKVLKEVKLENEEAETIQTKVVDRAAARKLETKPEQPNLKLKTERPLEKTLKVKSEDAEEAVQNYEPHKEEKIEVEQPDNGNVLRVGVAAHQGYRPSMEDAHAIHINNKWAFGAVFDGHGGDACAKFMASEYPKELAKFQVVPTTADLTKLAAELDTRFLGSERDQLSLDGRRQSGSTAAFVVVRLLPGTRRKLLVGNVGDSRVLLGKADGSIHRGDGTDFALTTDHKPDLPLERCWIEKHQGFVSNGRLCGVLSMSRAFGNAPLKHSGLRAEPQMRELCCQNTDFLLVACDGIFDHGAFNNASVIEFAAKHLASDMQPMRVAKLICQEAIRRGSSDNVTCMVVLMQAAK